MVMGATLIYLFGGSKKFQRYESTNQPFQVFVGENTTYLKPPTCYGNPTLNPQNQTLHSHEAPAPGLSMSWYGAAYGRL